MTSRLALIIANSDFDDPKLCRLHKPIQDAEALAEVLDDPDIGDFNVTLLINEPEPVMRRKIAQLYSRQKRSDLLLLYYSGHGIRDMHGDLYLAAKDTDIDLASATALSASFVREHINKSNSQRKVVVLDCCHSGAFVGGKSGLGDSVGTEDAFAGSGYGYVILTASDAVELSWEGDGWLGESKPSVFTNFLVEGLRAGEADLDGDGKIVLDELYDYVYEQILTSGYKQTPQKWAHGVEGQIVVAQNPFIKPAKLSPEFIQAIESPLASVRKGVVDDLNNLLHDSRPAIALAALKALERLSSDDSRQVSKAAQESLMAYAKARRLEQKKVGDEGKSSVGETNLIQSWQDMLHHTYEGFYSWIRSVPVWSWIAVGVTITLLIAVILILKYWSWPPSILIMTTPTTSPTDIPLTQEPTSISPALATPTDGPTLVPTSTPIRDVTLTPTNTFVPTFVATPIVPALRFPQQGRCYEAIEEFRWEGTLQSGQTYQVHAWHTESDFNVSSDLLQSPNWVSPALPADKGGEWQWKVSVLSDGRVLVNSDEGMFWYSPFGCNDPESPLPRPES
jgi:hypothetical protein